MMHRWNGIVAVTSSLDPAEYDDPEDRALSPVGRYGYTVQAANSTTAREQILDQFHREVPIGCLDDFEIVVEGLDCVPERKEHSV